MKQWEYKLKSFEKLKGLVEKFNILGKDGWEMCGVKQVERWTHYIFKREIESNEPVFIKGELISEAKFKRIKENKQ